MSNLSFEEAHQELEKILAAMNGGKVSLEESIHLYERGEKLMRHCEKQLESAELKIEKILKDRNGQSVTGPDGALQTAPLDEEVPF